MSDLLAFIITCQDFSTDICQICFCRLVTNIHDLLGITFTCLMITDG